MGSSEGQTYCLRWNNHKSNLVEILDALIKMESYVDCTIVVDDQVQFKAHRVVLAANSPYFQSILQDVPMDHCSILFPGVQAFEMRALLEYMYTGEVNVTQSQIPKIMKIAEQLEVKGLFDMTDLKEKFNKFEEPPTHYPPPTTPTAPSFAASKDGEQQQSSPVITTSTNVTSAQSSSASPPYSYKSPYTSLYSKSPGPSTSERHSQWPPISPHLPTTLPSAAAAAMLSSVYESASDMNPLKRKKLSSISSMLQYPTPKDTPILRNVLAQSHAADSSQPMPLICQPVKPERAEKPGVNNGCNGSEYSSDKKSKYEEPHSPYTDKSFEDDGLDCPPAYLGDSRLPQYSSQQQQKPEWKRYKQYTRSDILSAIECVRNGMSALQASRKYGVPSRTLYDKVKKLGITTGRPMNRTIKRSPSSGGGSAGFQFGMSGSGHPYGPGETMISQMHEPMDREKDREHHIPPTIPHPAAALLDPNFLQQAFEARGGDIAGREALHAMALAAAAHAAVNGMSTSPGTNGTARSPSPGLGKYQKPQSPHPSLDRERDREREREREQERERERDRERQRERERDRDSDRERERDHHMEEDEDKVEDLSMSRKDVSPSPLPSHHSYLQRAPHPLPQHTPPPQHQQTGGVIVPPMTKIPTNTVEDFSPVECKRELITDDSRD